MKLSIVISNQNNQIGLLSLLQSIFYEKKLDIEVVLLDSSFDRSIDNVFESFKEMIDEEKIKVVYSTNINDGNIVKIGLQYLTGDYAWFINSKDKVDRLFLKRFFAAVKMIDSEIIETDFTVSGMGSFAYLFSEKKVKNIFLDVKTEPSAIASISPFLVNKIFKTSFLKNNITIFQSNIDFETYYVYVLMYFCNKYYYLAHNSIDMKFSTDEYDLILDKYIEQWKYIIMFFKEHADWINFKQFIEYAIVQYYARTFVPLTKAIVEEKFDELRWIEIFEKTIYKEFPTFSINKLIVEDKQLQKIPLLKSMKISSKKGISSIFKQSKKQKNG